MNKGTIEGFFGREWTYSDRLAHCNFLSEAGYAFYIYAPKSDQYLRRHWYEKWPQAKFTQLLELSNHCKHLQLGWGIGLSPFELHLDFNNQNKLKLHRKIEEINQLNPDILCLLFDDMRGDKADLAIVQTQITKQVLSNCNANKIIVCPSYYTDDPILDKVFGQRPANYLEDLGELLPTEVDIFWTGSKVCSPKFTNEDIERVTAKLRRRPFLWDNYPVNDGMKMCNYLHLKGFNNRNNLSEDNISGHAINPMNQAWLSRIPLATLPAMYAPQAKQSEVTKKAIIDTCPKGVANLLLQNLDTFHTKGLAEISLAERQNLIDSYRVLPSSPYSNEVICWLEGSYNFDPDCLTD